MYIANELKLLFWMTFSCSKQSKLFENCQKKQIPLLQLAICHLTPLHPIDLETFPLFVLLLMTQMPSMSLLLQIKSKWTFSLKILTTHANIHSTQSQMYHHFRFIWLITSRCSVLIFNYPARQYSLDILCNYINFYLNSSLTTHCNSQRMNY